jgi:hypothetical protein
MYILPRHIHQRIEKLFGFKGEIPSTVLDEVFRAGEMI